MLKQPNSWDFDDILLHATVAAAIVWTTGGWGLFWNTVLWPFREWEQHKDKPVSEWSLQVWAEAVVPMVIGALVWWVGYG